MKKHALVLSIIPLLLLGACTGLQKPSNVEPKSNTETMMKKEDVEKPAMMDESDIAGFGMEGGKMRILNEDDEDETMMTQDVQLKSGMKVMMDGKVMMADGKSMMLKEGDAVMMDGTVGTVEGLELKMEKQEAMQKDEGTMMKKEDAKDDTVMMSAGAYKDATASNLPASVLADGKTKVLYFFAAWCPTCKKANQTLTSWYADGKGLLTVYKINYDEEKTLEQKYGVTYQHTFVKVDGQGNMIEKIQGPSDDELKRLLQS